MDNPIKDNRVAYSIDFAPRLAKLLRYIGKYEATDFYLSQELPFLQHAAGQLLAYQLETVPDDPHEKDILTRCHGLKISEQSEQNEQNEQNTDK